MSSNEKRILARKQLMEDNALFTESECHLLGKLVAEYTIHKSKEVSEDKVAGFAQRLDDLQAKIYNLMED